MKRDHLESRRRRWSLQVSSRWWKISSVAPQMKDICHGSGVFPLWRSVISIILTSAHNKPAAWTQISDCSHTQIFYCCKKEPESILQSGGLWTENAKRRITAVLRILTQRNMINQRQRWRERRWPQNLRRAEQKQSRDDDDEDDDDEGLGLFSTETVPKTQPEPAHDHRLMLI